MDQDNKENPNLHVKLMQDARTRKWQVKIRNLTKEQLDFSAGPRLLPTLAKTDAVVIEHNDTSSLENSNEAINHSASNQANSTNPNTLKPNDITHVSAPNKTATNSDTDKSDTLKMPMTPAPKPKQPCRSTAKIINYSTMAITDNPANSDSDEYLPQPEPPPKVNNKRCPSASRKAAQ